MAKRGHVEKSKINRSMFAGLAVELPPTAIISLKNKPKNSEELKESIIKSMISGINRVRPDIEEHSKETAESKVRAQFRVSYGG
ncbi:MAG: hypothetical protein UT66_C0028G0037 [candidate division CPR2 bacterium GW2011_GWC1_39_9]|uniref:Uncharacterized protein n=1 Tax=candidate division CPR2 bacterium GW2011_GWC2_39_10 TaxID=1618345 RepID=A0A0G0LUV1_UNCC2|nr:MAG: hypothetical protein UT18_C0007G0063 [candidate division CPR2 bacterium GW2011_GWC2_39_10]KKR34146.1 MAG: hypothetical protein UT66_C0028G0037 [candidate division CPR2 bacterium GW2011_GWC1_39_9]